MKVFPSPAKRVFGEDPKSIIEELNEVLVA